MLSFAISQIPGRFLTPLEDPRLNRPLKTSSCFKSRQNFSKEKSDGFTLLEILLVLGLIAILLIVTVPLSLDFYKRQQLEVQTQSIIQTLRRTQSKSMAVESDSAFGLYITNQNYILFKGDSYATRDSQYDEVFELPEIIDVGGLNEIVFTKLDGLPKETPSYCDGICTSCSNFTNRTSCQSQNGCSWSRPLRRCQGNCTPCNSYQDQLDCESQSGCVWAMGTRGGNVILNADDETTTININEMGRINLQ